MKTYESFGDFKGPKGKVHVPDVKVMLQEMWWEVLGYLYER